MPSESVSTARIGGTGGGVDMVMAAVVMGLAGMDEGSEEVVGREKAPPEEGTQGGSLAERVEA